MANGEIWTRHLCVALPRYQRTYILYKPPTILHSNRKSALILTAVNSFILQIFRPIFWPWWLQLAELQCPLPSPKIHFVSCAAFWIAMFKIFSWDFRCCVIASIAALLLLLLFCGWYFSSCCCFFCCWGFCIWMDRTCLKWAELNYSYIADHFLWCTCHTFFRNIRYMSFSRMLDVLLEIFWRTSSGKNICEAFSWRIFLSREGKISLMQIDLERSFLYNP